MSETETRPHRFDRAQNYREFVAFRGFHPQETVWEPMTGEDWRDPRDPQVIGKRIKGKKNVNSAADRWCPPLSAL